MVEDGRAQQLAQLAADLQRMPDEDVTARAVLDEVLTLVEGADSASITVGRRRNQFATLASTSEVALEADRMQYAVHEGPCVDTVGGTDWCRSGDLSTDRRWPTWGPRTSQELGLHSILSVRLTGKDGHFGAMNVYGCPQGLFASRDEVDLALLTATHAGIALTAVREISGLETALRSRHAIGMAQGILMERFELDEGQSFALLRRYSNALNLKLADVADRLLRTRELPELPRRDA